MQWGIGRYIYSLGFFNSGNPELPEDAIPEDEIDFSGLIIGERNSIQEILKDKSDIQVLRELDLVMSRYSPLVSLLQKRRILANLKEISNYLKRGS